MNPAQKLDANSANSRELIQEFTPQQIDAWRLEMDFLKLARGETFTTPPSIGAMSPRVKSSMDRVGLQPTGSGIGCYMHRRFLELH